MEKEKDEECGKEDGRWKFEDKRKPRKSKQEGARTNFGGAGAGAALLRSLYTLTFTTQCWSVDKKKKKRKKKKKKMWWKRKENALDVSDASKTSAIVATAAEPVLTNTELPAKTEAETAAAPTEMGKEKKPKLSLSDLELRKQNERLSLPLGLRLPAGVGAGFVSGLLLGMAKGSQDAGFRFRAENAHRLPRTQTGWFLYHKSKNYNMMFGGVLEGFKTGAKVGFWAGTYFVLEEGIDRGRAAGGRMWGRFWGGEWAKGGKESRMAALEYMNEEEEEVEVRGNRDCLSSMLAGLGTAGIFSAWSQFPLPTAARTAKMGAKAGLAFGLVQDALSVLKGNRVGYVEFLKRHTLGESRNEKLPG